jgi:drug/metabolite transporter (DMT)-like permease
MTHHPDRILTGIALMLGFCVTAPLIDVFSKLAAQATPVGTVTLSRFVVQSLLMAPIVLGMGLSWRLSGKAVWLTLARALVSILATFCFIAAVKVMPIADTLAIAFVEPFIILLIGYLVLKEQVGPRRLAASCVGFLGVLLVIQPSFSVFGPVAFLPLGTALFFALYILITRSLTRLCHPVAMQFHTGLFAVVLCVPMFLAAKSLTGEAALAIVWPRGIDVLWCFGVGLAATISHMAMTYALKMAPSSTLAPLHYMEMVTAALLGYLVFGDWPNVLTWAGIIVIVGSGLYIIHRERLAARSARLATVSVSAEPR